MILTIKQLKDIIAEKKPNTNDTTRQVYISNIRSIFKRVFRAKYVKNSAGFLSDDDSIKISRLFDNYTDVIPIISAIPTITTRTNLLNTIVVIGKILDFPTDVIVVYEQKMNESKSTRDAQYDSHEKTDRENANWITIAEYMTRISTLQQLIKKKPTAKSTIKDIITYYRNYQNLLLLLLYKEFDLRNDFALMQYSLDAPTTRRLNRRKENFINFVDKTMVLNRYKTVKKFGAKEILIPDELFKMIKKWQRFTQNDYMLVSISKETDDADDTFLVFRPMSKYTVIETLNKIFAPKKVSSTIICKVFNSEIDPVRPDEVDISAKMAHRAFIRGHGTLTQQKTYRKK